VRTFAIIGLSSFGYFLTKSLSEMGFDVMVIDSNEAKIDQVKSFVQKAILANATDRKVLERLDIKDVDVAVVSLGEPIDASILVTHYLRELGVKEIIAKATSEDHGKVLWKVGATRVIFPERDIAERLAQSLATTNILDYIPLVEGYSIVELAPPSSFVGRTLMELDLRRRYGVQVIVVKELVPPRIVAVPTPDYLIKDSDVLVILGRDEDIKRIQKIE